MPERLSAAQMLALEAMPVQCQRDGAAWCLPQFGPAGGTLKALEKRGLIWFSDEHHRWERTALGARVWATR